jgi:hypothetical protein
MSQAIRAGLAYVGLVFAAGFLLGTLRVLLLAPRFGESVAVLLELPLILGVAWFICGWLLDRMTVSSASGPRLLMGTVALVVLLAAEAGVSMLLMGRSLAQHLGTYRETSHQLGLAAQLLFATFPLLHALRPRSGRD